MPQKGQTMGNIGQFLPKKVIPTVSDATSAATENFGKLTLLRFLLAVIVMGAQAKKAKDAEPKKPPAKATEVLSDSKSSGDNDDDDGPLTFE
ncbi:unnamed protein product [Cylindrotheca closterium]|uniref:Uncharacterized protein n=1 Tax=Cylindrotheca closterium TaxID=2856 RepID=A0AAD2JMD3_9STRA|nr:unnamed protein product [Cylindrotheca closterium]